MKHVLPQFADINIWRFKLKIVFRKPEQACTTVAVNPCGFGREVIEYGKLIKRAKNLQHLNILFCTVLTETA